MKSVFALLLLLILATACGSMSKPPTSSVIMEHDAFITSANGEKKAIPANQAIEIGNEPVLVENPGRVGVLIVPSFTGSQQVKLNLKPLSEFGGREFEKYADGVLTEIMESIYQVQAALASKQINVAMNKVKELRAKYPRYTYLMLLEASCLLASGDRTSAKELIKAVLVERPDHPQAQLLMGIVDPSQRLPASKAGGK